MTFEKKSAERVHLRVIMQFHLLNLGVTRIFYEGLTEKKEQVGTFLHGHW